MMESEFIVPANQIDGPTTPAAGATSLPGIQNSYLTSPALASYPLTHKLISSCLQELLPMLVVVVGAVVVVSVVASVVAGAAVIVVPGEAEDVAVVEVASVEVNEMNVESVAVAATVRLLMAGVAVTAVRVPAIDPSPPRSTSKPLVSGVPDTGTVGSGSN
jgi:hypothetical protein